MPTRTSTVAALTAATSLLLGGVAVAHDSPSRLADDGVIDSGKETHAHDEAQHGGEQGHITVANKGVELVSKLALKNVEPGKIADVGVHNGYAYLAAWGGVTCTYNGVHVVDIKDPAAPREVAFIPSKEGSYPGEGVQALSVSTPAFTGDVLVTNNEICKGKAGVGGLNLYDVTNAARPTPLVVGYGDDQQDPGAGAQNKTAHQIHSVFAWDAGDRAYAALVDNEESRDVDILDISDPRKPVFVAEYDLRASMPQILQPGRDLDEVFLHDLVVKNIGGTWVMLASYWDGGYVQLDVTDPARATYIADTDFAAVDPEAAESRLTVGPEGNAHQAEFTADDKYVLAADEDFAPYALRGTNTTDGTPVTASQGSDTVKLPEGQTISGQTRFVGLACTGSTAVPPGNGSQIAVIERGACTFTEKVGSVTAAGGYVAALIFNRPGSDGCENSLSMSVSGTIPAFGVAPRSEGFALFPGTVYDESACLGGAAGTLPAVGATGDAVAFSSYFDGWGYVHLYERTPGKRTTKMKEIDTYAIPEAHDPAFADGFGDLSVHEVATSPTRSDLAYVSYYSGGLRVVKVGPRGITEVGAFIDEGGNNLWGVEVFSSGGQEYVAASDRDLGLYVFRATP